MKFIRDIINEKKQAAGTGEGDGPAIPMASVPPAADMTEALVLDDSHAVAEPFDDIDDDGFNLFSDEQVIEGTAEPVDSHVAEAETPVFEEAEYEMLDADDLPEAQAEALDAAPEDDPMTQHILARTENPDLPVAAAETAVAPPIEVPAPAAGRASRRAGRVKTRLLGFGSAQEAVTDPFAAEHPAAEAQADDRLPVGWIVVTDGPGQGATFTLFEGVSQIGRGEDQAIRLDFGDTSISRSNHAAVAYDREQKTFYLGHGGKANLVRMNGRPVLSTEILSSGDRIRIGETSLRFIGLCGPDFDWAGGNHEGEPRVSYG